MILEAEGVGVRYRVGTKECNNGIQRFVSVSFGTCRVGVIRVEPPVFAFHFFAYDSNARAEIKRKPASHLHQSSSAVPMLDDGSSRYPFCSGKLAGRCLSIEYS